MILGGALNTFGFISGMVPGGGGTPGGRPVGGRMRRGGGTPGGRTKN